MLVSFLQAAHAVQSSLSVGALLLSFLNFYGDPNKFDYRIMGLRVYLPDSYEGIKATDGSTPEINKKKPGFKNFFARDPSSQGAQTLHIEDPFNPLNNIGQSVFQYFRVQDAFSLAAVALFRALNGEKIEMLPDDAVPLEVLTGRDESRHRDPVPQTVQAVQAVPGVQGVPHMMQQVPQDMYWQQQPPAVQHMAHPTQVNFQPDNLGPPHMSQYVSPNYPGGL